MLTLRQENILAKWDIIITILSLLGVILFTSLTVIVNNNMRYFFIAELLYAINCFVKSVKSLKEYRQTKKQYSIGKVLGFRIA